MASTNNSASPLRSRIDTERWFFIAEYCKSHGISPMIAANYNKAAFQWAKLHSSFTPTTAPANLRPWT